MPDSIAVEMNFCRRCGSKFEKPEGHVYRCQQGHVIFLNQSPAVGIILYNDQHEVLVLTRAIDPGKGRLDVPGGFCDGAETLEDALAREIQEELGINPDQYTTPEFLCSGLDPYEFSGEILPVLAVMFSAHILPGAVPVADDDAASVEFMAPDDLDLGKVQFPTVRAAFQKWLDMRP